MFFTFSREIYLRDSHALIFSLLTSTTQPYQQLYLASQQILLLLLFQKDKIFHIDHCSIHTEENIVQLITEFICNHNFSQFQFYNSTFFFKLVDIKNPTISLLEFQIIFFLNITFCVSLDEFNKK